jgi:recombination protein RecT
MAAQSLRSRADGTAGAEVTRAEDTAPSLAQMIDRMRPEIQRALPKHLDADRVARIALTTLRQTPELARCTPESFLGALMTCSQLGLEPGPHGEAYHVPYGRVCTFIPGYRGLIKLMYQSGQIASVAAETVHEADHFEVHYGSERRIVHARPPLGVDRGKALGWYALAKFKDGAEAFVVMDRPEVERIRARSKAAKSGPWTTDYDPMAKKTCLRQLAKWVPLSAELATALSQDGAVRVDPSPAALELTPTAYVEGELVGDDAAPAGVDPDTGLIDGAEVADPPDWAQDPS